MPKSKSDSGEGQVVIVKKTIKKGGGHHGGAWKVAYADFVTAMMAFFLLLWLLNVSTDEALEVISSYFDPAHPKVSQSPSGAGGVLGGLSMTTEGAMAEMMEKPVPPQTTGYNRDTKKTGEQKSAPTRKDLEKQLKKMEDQRFREAKAEIEKALQDNAELRELAKHLQIDVTPEGLRIQIIDQEGEPMFAIGSAQMLPKMQQLMATVAGVIRNMPNNISVRGHTDSAPYAAGAVYTNWELSADRANTARRVLIEKGLETKRLHDVMGKADTEHLIGDNPLDARNRRISVILLRETLAQAMERGAFGALEALPPEEEALPGEEKGAEDAPAGAFQKTPGDVYFP